MPIKSLIELGLSEKEAMLYLALLELGVTSASEMARRTNINRSSAYVVLKSLEKIGLVTSVTNVHPGNEVTVQQFLAASPDALLTMAKKRSQHEHAIEKKIEVLIPELKALHKDSRYKPKVYVYEDMEATRRYMPTLLEEQTTRGMKTYRLYGDFTVLQAGNFLPGSDFGNVRGSNIKNSGITAQVLSTKTLHNHAETGYRKFGITGDVRLLAQESRSLIPSNLTALAIYEDKVGYFTENSHFIVIENKEMADVLKNIFDLAFETAANLE
jgi:DNA-binding transcriptional regulator GbsR (MarR family)